MKDYTDALKAFGEYVASLPWTGRIYLPLDTTLCEQRKCSWFLDAYFEEDAEHKLKGNLFHMAISYRGSEEHFYPNGDKYLLHRFKECTNPDPSCRDAIHEAVALQTVDEANVVDAEFTVVSQFPAGADE